ncbi:hypothetical protein BKA70DRAFT_1124516, partial [Coprinopsis sp. MPI-PUGE-AT-0042]
IHLDAPTHRCNYITPSATWRKDLPAVLSHKRARSQASADEPDALNGDQDDEELARHEMSPPGPNTTERGQIK